MIKYISFIFVLVTLMCSHSIKTSASNVNKKIFVQPKVLTSNQCVIKSNRHIDIFVPKDKQKFKVGSFTITNCSFVLHNINADYLQMNIIGRGNKVGSTIGLVLTTQKGVILNIKNIFYQNTCHIFSGVLGFNGKKVLTKLSVPCQLLKK